MKCAFGHPVEIAPEDRLAVLFQLVPHSDLDAHLEQDLYRLFAVTEERTGVRAADILSRSKAVRVAHARQAVCWALVCAGHSPKAIARLVGLNPSSVREAYRAVAERLRKESP